MLNPALISKMNIEDYKDEEPKFETHYRDFLQRKEKPGKSYARHFHGPWHCLSTHGNQAEVAMEHRFPIQMYFCVTEDVHLDFCRWTENFIFGLC